MKFKFIVNINDDVWNWHESATKNGDYGQDCCRNWPKDLPIKNGKNKDKIKAYLKEKYYKNNIIKKYSEWMYAAINPNVVNEELKKITGKDIPFKEVYVKITTYGRCPYDPDGGGFYSSYSAAPKWFYKVALHECMHLIVHRYYWKQMIDAGLTNAQAHDIKEALTVLLDPTFKEKWSLSEEGYPNHQNLRKDIEKKSKKTKDFDKIMTETIDLYLKKYKKKVS